MTKFEKFLAALAAPLQDLETAFQQMLVMRNVNTSIGVHLSALGKLVGRPRIGTSPVDDTYRRYVRAQIATNDSNGRIDEVLTIAELVVFDPAAEYELDNQGNAAYVLRVTGIVLAWDVAAIVLAFLKKATKAGVRVVVEWWTQPAANLFRFAPFTGSSTGRGYATFADPSDGGHLASAAG